MPGTFAEFLTMIQTPAVLALLVVAAIEGIKWLQKQYFPDFYIPDQTYLVVSFVVVLAVVFIASVIAPYAADIEKYWPTVVLAWTVSQAYWNTLKNGKEAIGK